MKRPTDKTIVSAIKSVLSKHKLIDSQETFTDLINEELRKINPEFSVGTERARILAITHPDVVVEVDTKRSPNVDVIDVCPCCNKELHPKFGKNLYGEKVILGFFCKTCGYNGTPEFKDPMRYRFRWKGK